MTVWPHCSQDASFIQDDSYPIMHKIDMANRVIYHADEDVRVITFDPENPSAESQVSKQTESAPWMIFGHFARGFGSFLKPSTLNLS